MHKVSELSFHSVLICVDFISVECSEKDKYTDLCERELFIGCLQFQVLACLQTIEIIEIKLLCLKTSPLPYSKHCKNIREG